MSNPYFAAVLQGAEQAARKYGYAVMLASVRDEGDWQPVVLDALASRAVDGFLLFTIEPSTERERAALRGKVVMVDALCEGVPSLQLDIEAGMDAAMKHLLKLGHTRIAHLAADVDAETFQRRHRAYVEALQAAGLPAMEAYHARVPFTIDGTRQVARQVLELAEPPSVIVCDSDVLAVGAYKAAKDLQRTIPQDLSVVSFDDSVFARVLEPELTTVAIPANAVGVQALQLLLAVLEENDVPSQTTIPLELVIRASTSAFGSK